jgi:hypothetical protein
MAARRVELGLKRPGIAGHEPSVGGRLEIVRDKRPLLRRRLPALSEHSESKVPALSEHSESKVRATVHQAGEYAGSNGS